MFLKNKRFCLSPFRTEKLATLKQYLSINFYNSNTLKEMSTTFCRETAIIQDLL